MKPVTPPIVAVFTVVLLSACSSGKSFPLVTIGPPSRAAVNQAATATFAVTYATAKPPVLVAEEIILDRTGTAMCTVSADATNAAMPTVTLSNCSGDGTVAIVVGAVASQPVTVDNIAPAVGTAVTFGSIAATSLAITWGAATDASASAGLEYRVVKAGDATRIDTLDEAAAITGADIVADWALTNEAMATMLADATTTYFAVIVRDVAGNMAVYAPQAGTTATGTWAAETYLKATNGKTGHRYGYVVRASADTVVVGAPFESSSQQSITNGPTAPADATLVASGAVYIYRRAGNAWTQEAFIKASDAASMDYFGVFASMSGDTIAVTAFNKVNGTGAVYVFKRTGTTWAEEAKLTAANGDPNDYFGTSVTIDGDTIAIGAESESSNQTTITHGSGASADNSAPSAGAVYVFRRTGTAWAQEAYVKAANGAAQENFGNSVALSGDTLVVGARNESGGQSAVTNGPMASADKSANSSGAVYVYRRTGTTWAQQAYVKASNRDAQDHFGESVAIDGDTLVVGATNESSAQTTVTNGAMASADNSKNRAGAVYIFKRTAEAWAQVAYLKAPNPDEDDTFGFVVAIAGNLIAVATPQDSSNQTTVTNGTNASDDNSASKAGSVQLFKRVGDLWQPRAYLKAANAGANDKFGTSVALSGNRVFVGAPDEDSNQTTHSSASAASLDDTAPSAGAAYSFVLE